MIVLDGVSKSFRSPRGTTVAVDHVSLRVERGSYCTLLGPSGCGKSTTLRMLAGLERPDGGRIAIDDRTLFDVATGIDVPANRRDVGMVFQSYALWPHLDVAANVAYPLRARHVGRADAADRVERMLELVGLRGMGARPSTRLSGGERQRVALARALVAEPEVLLLDEPMSNLDAPLRAQLQHELKDLQRRVGVTTIHVTHDRREALSMADQLVVLRSGAVCQQGTPEDVYRRPVSRFVAAFIGETNLLPVVDRDDVSVVTSIGRLPVPPGDADGALVLSVRPEHVLVAPADHDCPGGCATGQVVRTAFLGDAAECEVTIGSTRVRSVQPADGSPRTGDDVHVRVVPGACVVLPDEQA